MTYEITVDEGGDRLDAYLASHLPDLSRARVQQLLKAGEVRVNGRVAEKASLRVEPGDVICLTVPPPAAPTDVLAEDIPLAIVYQDADLVVLDKPAGLVVHPAAGHHTGTLVNALLHHIHDLSGIGGEERPGIVHRLDKDTSGLMLVAKHDQSHRALAAMIEHRTVRREYLALAWGRIAADGFTVDEPIGRHPSDRQRMACRPADATGARHAVTHITVVERLPHATLTLARLETGRTHQIRVHLQHAGYPVVGDPVYAGKAARRYLVLLDAPARATLESLPGQALHAWRLSFPHPRTGEALSFTAPTPPAFRNAYHALGGLANPEGHVGES